MTVNWENMKYKRCPKCGYNEHFLVSIAWLGQVRLHDMGTEEMSGGHTEWTDDSYVQCPACDWDGVMSQLEWMKSIPSIMKSGLITMLEYVQKSRETANTPGTPYPDLVLEDMDISDRAFDEIVQFFDDVLMEIGE